MKLYGVMFGYFPDIPDFSTTCWSEVNLMQVYVSDKKMSKLRSYVQEKLNKENPFNGKRDPNWNIYHIDTVQIYEKVLWWNIQLHKKSSDSDTLSRHFDYDDLFVKSSRKTLEEEYENNNDMKLYIVNMWYYFMPSHLPQANVEPRKYLIIPAKNPLECEKKWLEIAKKEWWSSSSVWFHVDNILELQRIQWYDIQLEYVGWDTSTTIETEHFFDD